jgi:CRP-like cAMP-binding protein
MIRQVPARPRTLPVEPRPEFAELDPTEGCSKAVTTPSNWPRNRLLLALPSATLERLAPELEEIKCDLKDILIDAESSLDAVYFPESGVISTVAVYADGSIIEMATIGREGCTGPQVVFGAKKSSARYWIQVPGSAIKMSRQTFQNAMARFPPFHDLMYAYIGAFLEQVLLSNACNGQHSLKQRLARWLLMMRDRHDHDVLPITQDVLAEMLGVERPSVTNTARKLENAGAIKRHRGQITICDRQGLMRASCECYQMMRERTAFHLPKTYPATG